jgi:hypothetical protein
MKFEFAKKCVNRSRFLLAKAKRKTVRYYCGDLAAFYRDMDRDGFEYVVLRWADKVPMDASAQDTYQDDVDHLIANDSVRELANTAARHGGSVKCDWYSVSGQSGSGFLAMPYYMPVLARKILNSRWRDPRGFYRPAAKEEFLAFIFHLCYHKGHRCGIPTGNEAAHDPNPKSDYAKEASRLAEVAGIALAAEATLLDMHILLKSFGWNMPYDLMLRWPDRHPFLTALQEVEEAAIKDCAVRTKDLTVFVMRDDCDTETLEEIVRTGVKKRFEILREIALSETQVERVMAQTRGGNWVERQRKGIVAPTRVLICQNAPTPGPLPIAMTEKKLQSRYPHISNTDVLIKRVIRNDVISAAGDGMARVVLHATDNPLEAAETLSAVLGDTFDATLSELGF